MNVLYFMVKRVFYLAFSIHVKIVTKVIDLFWLLIQVIGVFAPTTFESDQGRILGFGG